MNVGYKIEADISIATRDAAHNATQNATDAATWLAIWGVTYGATNDATQNATVWTALKREFINEDSIYNS